MINVNLYALILVLLIVPYPSHKEESTHYSAPIKHHKCKLNSHYKEVGEASWYGPGFDGRKTASGDIFYQDDITAASLTLPLYSRVWVTNLANGKKILVTVNDRGPYAKKRIMDLSRGAAIKLGFKDNGVTKVKIEYDKVETERFLNSN